MNKSMLTAVAVVAVSATLIGCGAQPTPTATTQPAPTPTVVEVANASNYELYSPTVAEAAMNDGKDVAVFFHSKSCGSCATLDADIVANASDIDSDVVILKADWDENQDLAAQYGVTGYHTVAYMNDDDSTTNVKGLFTLNDVLSNF